ncbi:MULTISPECIES: PAS domain S-box protein [Flavobacterium]|uniref:PAS domain-containing sensor histidine kinase n=1 Tax=Flavobacterium TaxID=237 RepID=UPI0021154B49|nr:MULTISPECIES: PAS domain S-box protein [Flavobacterium]UUF14279.1 PAS domain S-box protein [Flavobacterium panici]
MSQEHKGHYFLADGGEMGVLIRFKDWSKTPLGDPENWPQSLRTITSVMLNNPFGMYIAWGKDFTQLYNDAFLKIIGSEKHPQALGNSPKDTFSEIWNITEPMFEEAMQGKSVSFPDFVVPLNKNGIVETCYFDFSYSPIRIENGEVGGVLVTVIETTAKKKEVIDQVEARSKLEESEQKIRQLVENAPFPIAVYVGEEMRIELANESIIKVWGKGHDVIGKSYREILPELNNQSVFEQVLGVLKTGKSFHNKNAQIDITINNKLETFYFNYSFTPLFDTNGNVYAVMNTAAEVTDLHLASKKIEIADKRFRDTVKQAPIGITILRGPDYIVESANEDYLKLVAREEEDFVGKPLFDSLPEVKDTVDSLLKNVLTTGIPYHGNEVPIPLNRYGKLGIWYFDFLYHPLREENGEITGIIVTVTEVTEKVEARKKIEQNEERLNIIVEASELGTWELNVKTREPRYSQRYLEIIGGYKEEIMLSHEQLLQHLHPDDMHIRNKGFKDALSLGALHYEVRTIWLDKSIHWIEGRGKVFYDENGNPEKLIGTIRDITAEKKHQQEVEQSEKRFRNLVMQSPVPKAILKGSEMVVEIANLALLETIWNKKESDVQGKKLFEIFPELLTQKYSQLLNEVFATGKTHSEIESPILINGNNGEQLFYIDFEYAPIYETDNSVSGIRATIIDVTEKVETRKKIEESEKRFRSLTESIPQLIWETDEKGNALFTSGKWEEYTGIKPAGETEWKAMIHPDDYEENIKIWTHSLETGQVYRTDVRVLRKDGSYRWHAVIGEPVLDENNKIIKWVGAFTDIHTEKAFTHELEQQVTARTKELSQMYDSLKKSEERYHLMIEEVQDYAILYLNHKGIVENWNVGAEKIKGYKAQEITGKYFGVFYTPEDQKNNVPNTLLELAREKGRAVHQGWRVRKNGNLFWASVVITAIHNKNNDVIGFSKVTHDLTEKKRADDKIERNALELEQKNAELEHMNKELQSFAYISSHDLQEPLRKIQTFASQILDKEFENLSDSGKDKFKRMQNAAKRMQTLINDLLSYSRTNIQERIFEKANLSNIIDEVREDLKEELEQKNAVIENNDIGEINIIPFQFRQLLYNLISNSLKFSKPDIPAVIKINSEIAKGSHFKVDALAKETRYCHITVSDNGIGFEAQYSKKIFDVFQRLHGRDQYTGTGIGLAIVKKIVENHNGIITAKGEKNKGASFDIYIPLQ